MFFALFLHEDVMEFFVFVGFLTGGNVYVFYVFAEFVHVGV